MSKVKHFIDCDQANEAKICLPTVNNLPVEANVGKASLSSFGGLAILKGEEQHLALASQLASCIRDKRNPLLIHHTLEEIIMTRIFQICLGYEDVNDCDRMREQLLLVAVCVRMLKTKVILDYPKHVPRRQELCHALEFYQTVV